MSESKIIEYRLKGKNAWGENISVLLNQSFVITNVEFDEGAYGAVAIFTVGDDGKKYYTSSKVLTKQAMEIAQLIKEGYKVKVTLRKVKRYLTF
jgi:hypothetical protein